MTGVVFTLVMAMSVVGCSSTDSAGPAASSQQFVRSDEIVQPRGELIRTEPGPAEWAISLPADSRTTRITYSSTYAIDNSRTEVSGAIFVPAGTPPAGGWPLVAYAHGTTGITRGCAPSDQATMFGDLAAINDFLSAGYAVVTTDYQGLGLRAADAPHPYLEPRTAAYNVVDAVRAARVVEPSLGQRWLAAGISQGGGAAWSTAEEYDAYGANSGELVGVVAVAPLLDATYLVRRAQRGQLTAAQRLLYPMVVEGMAQSDPAVMPQDHLSGMPDAERDLLRSCTEGVTALAAQRPVPEPDALVAVTPEAAETLDKVAASYALPRTETDVPILVVYGGADNVIPSDVVEEQLGRACGLGHRLHRIRHEGQGHTLDPGPIMRTWMTDRFDARPETGNCRH